MSTKAKILKRAKIRKRTQKQTSDRLRLSIFRSSQHIYAQLIDDEKGITVAASSTLDKSLKLKKGADTKAAGVVGKAVAESAQKALKTKDIKVRFDRGPFLFHGRVKALAEAAREAGLIF